MNLFIAILILIIILISLYIYKQREDRRKLPDDPNYVEPIVEDETEVKQEN